MDSSKNKNVKGKSRGRGDPHMTPTEKVNFLNFLEKEGIVDAMFDREKDPMKKGIQFCNVLAKPKFNE